MLLPVTSSMNWLARRPLMAEKSERSMVCVPSRVRMARRGPGGGGGWSGGDLDDVAECHLGTADPENGSGGREPDRVDDARVLGVVGPGVGDGAADQSTGAKSHLRGERLGGLLGDGVELLQRRELCGLRQEL